MRLSAARTPSCRQVGRLAVLAAALFAGAAPGALATTFSIISNSTTPQSLTGSETGSVASGVTLTTGTATPTVGWAGSGTTNPTLTNSGTISSTGGRAIDMNTAMTSGSFTLNNNAGALINSGAKDGFAIRKAIGNGTVTVNNSGTISETGITGATNGQALDFDSNNSASSHIVINNFAGGSISASDSDAIRPGINATINNYGSITAGNASDVLGGNHSSNDAIDFQTTTNVGGVVNNYTGGSSITGARAGITGKVTAQIYNEGTITGQDGAGLNFDTTTGGMSITNKGTISGTGVTADGDGVDIDYLVSIDNYGAINAFGSVAGETQEALAIGGGTVNNFAGATLSGSDRAITVNNSAATPGSAFGSTTIYNEGTITGGTVGAINILSTFANTLTNKGTITGGVVLGSNTDTINLHTGSHLNGALDGGAGSDTIHLTGASIGNGSLSNVSNVETLSVDAGNWALSTSQSYSNGITVANGAAISVTGALGGNLTNNGTVKVDHASATFTGNFTNNGVIASDPATLTFAGDLLINTNGAIQAMSGDRYIIDGNFLNHSTNTALWSTGGAALEFAGAPGTDHTLLLNAANIGADIAGYNNLSWAELDIEAGNTLSLGDGIGIGAAALYVEDILGVLLSGGDVLNITGNGLDIYYDPWRVANAYLGGLTYHLQSGGDLIADAPEPASAIVVLTGAGLLLAMRRRRAA